MVFIYIGFLIEMVIVFIVFLVGVIFIDLFMYCDDKLILLKSVVFWFVFWVVVVMVFVGFFYIYYGVEVVSLFVMGYVLEKVLLVDNLFVMMVIFFWFVVSDCYCYCVFYWGIIGVIVFRGIFVVIGMSLLSLGLYVEVVFVIIVVWMVVMMFKSGDDDDEIEDYFQYLVYCMVKCFFFIWLKFRGYVFLFNQKEVDVELVKLENSDVIIGCGKKVVLYVILLFLCVVVVEFLDVMFVFDLVLVIIVVSCELFIVYSVMMFVILGLCILYFVFEVLKQYLVYLEKVVIVLLFFIVVKFGLNVIDYIWYYGYSIVVIISLYVVLGVLVLGIFVSVMFLGKFEFEEKGS